jgi:DNA-binding IclR family transcriptional regulator
VERAIALLEAVSDAPAEGETVAALAAACGLNRATAWRLLATLEAYDLVHIDPVTRRYSIGLAISRLSAAGGVVGLTRRTHGVLVRLSERTQETADLAVAHRLSLTYVAEVAPPSVLSANCSPGSPRSSYCRFSKTSSPLTQSPRSRPGRTFALSWRRPGSGATECAQASWRRRCTASRPQC